MDQRDKQRDGDKEPAIGRTLPRKRWPVNALTENDGPCFPVIHSAARRRRLTWTPPISPANQRRPIWQSSPTLDLSCSSASADQQIFPPAFYLSA